MNLTGRSVAAGLGAWVLAYFVALACRIEPDRIMPTILSLACSLAIGVAVVLTIWKRYCLQLGECRNALFIFLTVWFTGIYAPISALAANAEFFAWRINHEAKAASHILAPHLAPAIEHLCSSHLAGSITLLGCVYLLIGGFFRTERPQVARLSWPDLVFGALTWLVAAVALLLGNSNKWHWIGITAGAILISVLYSTIRIQWRALRSKVPTVELQPVPRAVGWVTICLLWLTLPTAYAAPLLNFPSEWMLLWMMLASLLPWVVFVLMTRKIDPGTKHPSTDSIAFAVRCGFWSGVAVLFVIEGIVLAGIADSLLQKSIGIPGGLATPFASTVAGLKPIYKLWLFPVCFAYVGGFFIAGLLPQSTRATHRILTSAYGGGAAWAVSGFTVVLIALNLARVTVTTIPVGEPLSSEVVGYFAQNGWCRLGLWDVTFVMLTIAGGALTWAIEASVICGLIWLRNRTIVKSKPITESLPQPIPTKYPQPGQNV